MLILIIITATLLLPQPTPADLDRMGALLCGEACGMGQEAMGFVGAQLRHDWYSMGTHGLARRWYAPLKPNEETRRIMEAVFDNEATGGERCRLVGNGRDVAYWLEGGYLPPGAKLVHYWESHGMSISAFDCAWQPFVVVRWECEGWRCPR